MTLKEAAGIMTILEQAFPMYYAKWDEKRKYGNVRFYSDMFSNVPGNLVLAAVQSVLMTSESRFPPSIGEINQKIREIAYPKSLSANEAWALVSKACANGIYNSQEEFDKLPPEVQMAVGSAGQIKSWAQVDADTFQTVIASNFRQSFNTVQKRERDKQMLPENVQKVIAGMAGKMALPESGDTR